MLRGERVSVGGYQITSDVVGEGSYGRVHIGLKPSTGEKVAIKMIPKQHGTNAMLPYKKEAVLHKRIPAHPNIIHMTGYEEDTECMYIILEYAGSGELFDRIAPDVGLEEKLAHFYFVQLVAGMEHLHANGVSHRDLKPEACVTNLLLDDDGNLKISDFGLATIFYANGNRRTLNTPCGTPPYVAPEIHSGSYQGDEVDIWSAGIILYTLLAGNTPWAEPTAHDPEFMYFCESYPELDYPPWNQLPEGPLELLRGILNTDTTKRFTVDQIQKNRWFAIPNDMLTDGKCNNPMAIAESMMVTLTQSGDYTMHDLSPQFSYTQPEAFQPAENTSMDIEPMTKRSMFSFSQPAVGRIVIDNSPTNDYGQETLSQFKRQFKEALPTDRLTRFYTEVEANAFMTHLSSLLASFLVPHKIYPMTLVFTTVDKRKCPLNGVVEIQPMSSSLNLVVIRKSKGDSIEFKRFFKSLMEHLKPLVVADNQH
ncbi:hypothetical protein SmJEL517_g02132 [Synchytrium microbalum]|uniref:non-specific serine/threonine protein kinase n=1 Tax=Synchytrium microbalum TaxID=1806994 RepID=A0A507C8Q7_9FUNG|nr:uncharacterized protein SmJEL517_g02132 [Synchytrium microbalum]TPX35529.1 hypothetical protein SmJEL517_g02132 [Synchytrium microbalum]